MTDETKKKRKSHHVLHDLSKPLWIIMRQTPSNNVIEFAHDEKAARSAANAMAVKSGALVAVFGPQAFTYGRCVAVETPFEMPE